MQNVKSNQIWRTKAGRLALIVRDLKEDQTNPELKMLWFDETDGEFCVSQIFNRLEQLLFDNGDLTAFLRFFTGANNGSS